MVNNILESFIQTHSMAIMDMTLVQPNSDDFLLPDVKLTGSALIFLSVTKSILSHFASVHGEVSKVKMEKNEVINMIVHFENQKKAEHYKMVNAIDPVEPVFSCEQLKVAKLYEEVHSQLADFIIYIVENTELKERLNVVIQGNNTLKSFIEYYSIISHCSMGASDFDQLDKDLSRKYSEQEEQEGTRELSKILLSEYEIFLAGKI